MAFNNIEYLKNLENTTYFLSKMGSSVFSLFEGGSEGRSICEA